MEASLCASDETPLLLYVVSMSEDWLFLDRAVDLSGKELPTHVMDRQVWGKVGRIREHLLVEMSREALDAAAVSGLSVKLYGRRGNVVVTLPAYYVAGFLRKVQDIASSGSRN